MGKLKKVLMGVLAVAALGLGGAALAGATSGNGNGNDNPKGWVKMVSRADASQAGAAATKAVGGGQVVSVERSDEGGGAVYEVKVSHSGTVTEVNLDKAFAVTARQADDDHGATEKSDGDGETNDDGGQ